MGNAAGGGIASIIGGQSGSGANGNAGEGNAAGGGIASIIGGQSGAGANGNSGGGSNAQPDSPANYGDGEGSSHGSGGAGGSFGGQAGSEGSSNGGGAGGHGASAVFTIGSQTYTAYSGQPLAVGGSTLLPGGSPITVGGHVLSMQNGDVVVDGKTMAYSPDGAAASEAIISLGSRVLTAFDQAGSVVIGSKTLSVGGPAATISGEVISMAPSGLVIDGAFHPFSGIPTATEGGAGLAEDAVFTIAGHVYTAIENPSHAGTAVINGPNGPITLTVGGPPTTVDGKVVSFGPSGIVVGNSQVAFHPMTASGKMDAIFTDPAGHVHTAIDELGGLTAVVDGSITLSVGGPAKTIDGEVVSLGSNGLVIDGSITESFSNPTSGQAPATSGPEVQFSSRAAMAVPCGSWHLWLALCLGTIWVLVT
jgi:hypothetical protein